MHTSPTHLAPLPPATNTLDPSRLQFIPETPEDTDLLVTWLTTDTWPFHGSATPTEATVREMVTEWKNHQTLSVWVTLDDAVRIGRVVVRDLEDLTAVASFRIRTAYRGRGIGIHMVRWAADTTFRDYPRIQRVEGQTRADNFGMRRVFRRAGWVPEAYSRRSWPDADGALHDSIGYAILRPDWETNTSTPVPWPFGT